MPACATTSVRPYPPSIAPVTSHQLAFTASVFPPLTGRQASQPASHLSSVPTPSLFRYTAALATLGLGLTVKLSLMSYMSFKKIIVIANDHLALRQMHQIIDKRWIISVTCPVDFSIDVIHLDESTPKIDIDRQYRYWRHPCPYWELTGRCTTCSVSTHKS